MADTLLSSLYHSCTCLVHMHYMASLGLSHCQRVQQDTRCMLLLLLQTGLIQQCIIALCQGCSHQNHIVVQTGQDPRPRP